MLGIDPAVTSVGPLASVEVGDGRALDTDVAGALVALVDATYATTNEIAVGDTIDVAGSDVEIVGIVASTADSADGPDPAARPSLARALATGFVLALCAVLVAGIAVATMSALRLLLTPITTAVSSALLPW